MLDPATCPRVRATCPKRCVPRVVSRELCPGRRVPGNVSRETCPESRACSGKRVPAFDASFSSPHRWSQIPTTTIHKTAMSHSHHHSLEGSGMGDGNNGHSDAVRRVSNVHLDLAPYGPSSLCSIPFYRPFFRPLFCLSSCRHSVARSEHAPSSCMQSSLNMLPTQSHPTRATLHAASPPVPSGLRFRLQRHRLPLQPRPALLPQNAVQLHRLSGWESRRGVCEVSSFSKGSTPCSCISR